MADFRGVREARRPMTEPESNPNEVAAGLVLPHVAALSGYQPGEQPGALSFVKLNTNENPYPPAPGVAEAIARACADLRLYPDPSAAELRRCAGEIFGVDPEGIVVGNGSDELLTMLIRSTVGPGGTVAYPVPTYSLYDTLVDIQGARAERIPWPEDHSLPQALATVSARILFVCNPNAPSGTVVPISDLENLAHAQKGRVVVVDEAYVDFADENALPLLGKCPNVVVLRSMSKSYSLAGLRLGLALMSPALARHLHKVRDSYNVNRLAQAGGLAALSDQATMLEHVERVRATRHRLSEALREMGFTVLPSQTNFVLARRPGEDLSLLAQSLREQRILIRYFGALPDAIRVSVGTDAEIDMFLAALRVIEES